MNVRLEERIVLVLAMVALVTLRPSAQAPLFTTAFPPDEFAARRAKVFDAIGDGVAVLQGAAEYPAYVRFRQNNQFFYLTGVEVPRALLLLDGRTKTATLFLAPRNERMERSEGPVLVPDDEAVRLTGIAKVLPRDDFGDALKATATPAGRSTCRIAQRAWAPARHRRPRCTRRLRPRTRGTDGRRGRRSSSTGSRRRRREWW